MFKAKNSQGFAVVETLLVVILLLLVGFIGYYVYHANSKTTDTYNAASDTAATPVVTTKKAPAAATTKQTTGLTGAGAKQLVDATFTSYTKARMNPNVGPKEALAPLKANFTSELYTKLIATTEHDPLTCAQEPVPSFTTVLESSSNGNAAVTVKEAFKSPLNVMLTVDLNAGKINSLMCPRS